MKKITLFFISALFFSLFATAADNYPLSLTSLNSNGGSDTNSSYNPDTKTITFVTQYAVRGWWFGDIDFSAYEKVVVKFNAPTTFGVNIKIEYSTGDPTEKWSVTGVTEHELELDPARRGSVKQIYLQNNTANVTLTLTDAYLVPAESTPPASSAVFDFEADAIGTTYGMKAWNSGDGTATVEANPTNATEKSVHIITSNWNAVIALPVTLPAGKTLADIESLSFDVYITNEDSQNKKKEVYIDGTKVHEDDGYPNQGALNTWTTKNIMFSELSVGLSAADLAKSTFTLAAGISTNNGNYFIDNIRLNEKPSALNRVKTAPAFFYHNGIISVLNGKQADITVFNILGKQILSAATASTLSLSNLPSGIYIVKVKVDGQNNTAKIVK